MNEQINGPIFLRPRFKIFVKEDGFKLIKKFEEKQNSSNCKFIIKIVDNHIVLDILKDESKFWSPQLAIEIEQHKPKESLIKGLFGPKPHIWTFFIFIHFAIALAFIGFCTLAYVQYSLKESYSFALTVSLLMPLLWFVMYFIGRWGKHKSLEQMLALHNFMMNTLES